MDSASRHVDLDRVHLAVALLTKGMFMKPVCKPSKLSVAVIAALATAASANAQQLNEDPESLEEVVVTGSRIPRADLVANSPVAVVGAEEFELAATMETESLLNTLPQVVPSFGATTNNPGTGTATIDLRNLGTVRHAGNDERPPYRWLKYQRRGGCEQHPAGLDRPG